VQRKRRQGGENPQPPGRFLLEVGVRHRRPPSGFCRIGRLRRRGAFERDQLDP
jgi:hypothetical protein